MKSKCMEVLKKISEVFYLEHDAEWSLVLSSSSLVVGKSQTQVWLLVVDCPTQLAIVML